MITRLAVGSLFLLLTLQVSASPACSHLKGCERKFCEIEQELGVAKAAGNNNKAKGLTRSLENAKASCTDKKIRENLLMDIEETRSDIADYESDIREAEEDGKLEKITKYKRKIAGKETELKLLEDELTELDK
ncbi:DUF1090 domain-containing protein [Cellvibrio polysaccharolyticus]|uniref:DUF1090 domain-containing protein n=1 Tax=Cellvibrio polysaccharolyticus TaxID=2082724 RepID=A0A928YSU1_9GAMM|nr:DUF1090 domain-containing protein [Cellvibrio polysaccharolyticus]MBE8716112.1 DUF1090 domain-containing protein [Cellvibrio polysaccharolyticus]